MRRTIGSSVTRLCCRGSADLYRFASGSSWQPLIFGRNLGRTVLIRIWRLTKGNVPGTLNARATYQNVYSGKGLATGGPKEGFAGHYHVRYYDEQGKFSDEYDLVIEKAGAFYNASRITDGKVSAGGVGMEVEEGLATGWHRVTD